MALQVWYMIRRRDQPLGSQCLLEGMPLLQGSAPPVPLPMRQSEVKHRLRLGIHAPAAQRPYGVLPETASGVLLTKDPNIPPAAGAALTEHCYRS